MNSISEGLLGLSAEPDVAQDQVLDLSFLVDSEARMPMDAAQFDAVQYQPESGSVNFDTGRGDVAEIREPECPLLKGLVPDGEAISIEVEELDLVGSSVPEDEK